MDELTPLPAYHGARDRVTRFLDAVAASTAGHGPRSELAPAGLMGWRGADGYYHELTEADLRELCAAAGTAEA